MALASDDLHRTENLLLRSLPQDDLQRLRPHLQSVNMKPGDILCEAGAQLTHAWFIRHGIVSLMATTLDGNMVEVGMVGNEGMIGLPMLLERGCLPYRAKVQLPGEAWRIPLNVLQHEFDNCQPFQRMVLRYVGARLLQLTQSGVCNHFHTIEQRLCRWLLILHDSAGADSLQITQEMLAGMLGVRRAGVSQIAGRLQAEGTISYRRGRIRVLDSERLAEAACECYGVIRKENEKLIESWSGFGV